MSSPGGPGRVAWQGSLLDGGPVRPDPTFHGLRRIALDAGSWVDHCPGWLAGSEGLFAELAATLPWAQHRRWMYEREVDEPRLTCWWDAAMGPPPHPAVEEMRAVLGARYGVTFTSAGFNLYRDGRDSVAWHGDRIAAEVADPVVALVSLGEPRKFLLRRKGGGPSTALALGRGDLLVTGGLCQREWEHSVPKVAAAGPRISIALRHGAR